MADTNLVEDLKTLGYPDVISTPLVANALPPMLRGMNLVGNDRFMGATTWPTEQGLAYFLRKGFNAFRLLTKWNNLQKPTAGLPAGALDPTNLALLKAVVRYLTNRGAVVVIDCHDYARYSTAGTDVPDSQKAVIGDPSSPVTNTMFASFWALLALEFRDNPLVVFEPTNEPYGMAGGAAGWGVTAQAVITAIRNTGARNAILIDGYNSSGANEWLTNGNSTAMLALVDPINNTIFGPHMYMGVNGESINPVAVLGNGPSRLIPVTLWARANNKRLWLGEWSFPNNADGLVAGREAIEFIEANSDVWGGWFFFGAFAGQTTYLTPDTGAFWYGCDPDTYDPMSAVDDLRISQVMAPYLNQTRITPVLTTIAPGSFTANRTTVTTVASPDGTANNARKIVEDTSTGSHGVYSSSIATVVGRVSLTFDVKRDTGSRDIYIKLGDQTSYSNYATAIISLDTGKVAMLDGNAVPTKFTRLSVSVRKVDNATWRISVSTLINSTSGATAISTDINMVPAGSTALADYAGNGSSALLIFNAKWKTQS